LDLGAFQGEWSKEMITKYGGKSHMFEILPSCLSELKSNCTGPNYYIHEFGLSSETKVAQTSSDSQGAGFSVYNNNTASKMSVSFKRMSDFLVENNIGQVDVCKINIEGGEYDLLEHMLHKGIHLSCNNIQVQFHGLIGGCYPINDFFERRIRIRKELEKTHRLTYDYYFVWENWEIRNNIKPVPADFSGIQ